MKVTTTYSNRKKVKSDTYTRLFGKEAFSVNIMYDERETGILLKQVVENSKFK